jgi:hypothetical protein
MPQAVVDAMNEQLVQHGALIKEVRSKMMAALLVSSEPSPEIMSEANDIKSKFDQATTLVQ